MRNDSRDVVPDRTRAMKWWNNLESSIREQYCDKYFSKYVDFLTGREIEKMWKEESNELTTRQRELIDESLESIGKPQNK